jgi:hypothetical protein
MPCPRWWIIKVMLSLGQKLSFAIKRDPETSEYKLDITLKDLDQARR